MQMMGSEPHVYTVSLLGESKSKVLTLGAGAQWS